MLVISTDTLGKPGSSKLTTSWSALCRKPCLTPTVYRTPSQRASLVPSFYIHFHKSHIWGKVFILPHRPLRFDFLEHPETYQLKRKHYLQFLSERNNGSSKCRNWAFGRSTSCRGLDDSFISYFWVDLPGLFRWNARHRSKYPDWVWFIINKYQSQRLLKYPLFTAKSMPRGCITSCPCSISRQGMESVMYDGKHERLTTDNLSPKTVLGATVTCTEEVCWCDQALVAFVDTTSPCRSRESGHFHRSTELLYKLKINCCELRWRKTMWVNGDSYVSIKSLAL